METDLSCQEPSGSPTPHFGFLLRGRSLVTWLNSWLQAGQKEGGLGSVAFGPAPVCLADYGRSAAKEEGKMNYVGHPAVSATPGVTE